MAKDDENPTFGKILKWGLLGVVGLTIVGVAGSFLMTAGTVATAPGRVVTRTLETGNIINNYEWYYDAYAQYRSRLAQASEHAKMMDGVTDASERSRLATELSAIRQSCRDLATRYNANATKTNKAIFKGREAPEELSMEKCG